LPIEGLAAAARQDHVAVFHAGTARVGDQIVTAGGRVLGVTAWGLRAVEARDRAYRAVSAISFDGEHHRRDIAAAAE
jgi:phosphoribosylamine--glycine ligase